MGRKEPEVRGKGGEPVVPGMGPRMRDARNITGMTLLQVADEIDATKPHLSEIENSLVNPGIYLFFEYCDVVGGDPTYILTGRSGAPDPSLAKFFENWRVVVGKKGAEKLRSLTVEEIRLSWERGMDAVDLDRLRGHKP